MRQLQFFFVTLSLLLAGGILPAQQPAKSQDPWGNTRKGNSLYKQKNYAGAEKYYRDAVTRDSSHKAASYNLGNALYRQQKYDEAGKAYNDALGGSNPDSLARTWHNLGNAMLQQKKYAESIKDYEEALRRNPSDEQTRYNLAYAQEKLRKQQPPPKNNQGKNGSSRSNKNNSGSNKQNQQSSNPQQRPNNGQNPGQQQQDPTHSALSQQEAQRMLNAIRDQEKKTRQKMNNSQNGRGYYNQSKTKDW